MDGRIFLASTLTLLRNALSFLYEGRCTNSHAASPNKQQTHAKTNKPRKPRFFLTIRRGIIKLGEILAHKKKRFVPCGSSTASLLLFFL
jgi:hypothetical protein